MPDTRRDRSALATLLADNTSKAIDAQRIRDLLESVHPSRTSTGGLFSARPSSGILAGDLFNPTDGPFLQRHDGTAWRSRFAGFPVKPVAETSGWAWVNQGDATLEEANGATVIKAPTTSGLNWRIRDKAVPSTPYAITFGFIPLFPRGSNTAAGLCFRDSASGKLQSITVRAHDGYLESGCVSYNNPSTFQAEDVQHRQAGILSLGPMMWLRIADDGTDQSYQYSLDGRTFVTERSHAHGAWFVPDRVGFYLDTCNDTYSELNTPRTSALLALSWQES